ncbi:MAG: threonine synthase [Planctomycetota bacterium]
MNVGCRATYELDEAILSCPSCGELLDIRYDWSGLEIPPSLSFFSSRVQSFDRQTVTARLNNSGVWRYRELLPFAREDDLITLGEGRTHLQQADNLAAQIGQRPGCLFLQYEGFNPSGSFKDNGMAAAFTMARLLGRRRVACASTGNTSASLALYAAHTNTKSGEPMQAVVLVGNEKIAAGKLAQALDFGAKTLQVRGDFDACMRLIVESAGRLGLYVVNSVNPFRLEGQKTIMYRVLEGLNWEVPDWIVVPGGNLGNCSAFGKAFLELAELGLIDRMPRLAVINADGADTLHELFVERGLRYHGGRWDRAMVESYYRDMKAAGRKAHTVASAIEIAQPVNLPKALRSLEAMDGVVRRVSDEAILDGKALVGRYGFGCEPASGATIAGLQLLLQQQVISPGDRVVCILTGHALKDPSATIDYHRPLQPEDARGRYSNRPVSVSADFEAICRALGD